MACYYPLDAWQSEFGGKLVFTGNHGTNAGMAYLRVPCGQCIGCRLERSRLWAVRILEESQLHEISSFLTLTYDEDHCPVDMSLHKRDLQLFFKRLRRSLGQKKIRYYACGEYGDISARPHYHAIVFGYWPTDGRFYKSTPYGQLRTSSKLEELWGQGFCTVGPVTFETAAYASSYVLKKIVGRDAEYHYGEKTPEFAVMSRNPGLASDWYENYKDEIWRSNTLVCRGREMAPPRYFWNKFKKFDPEAFETAKHAIKEETKALTDEQRQVSAKVREHNLKIFQKSQI